MRQEAPPAESSFRAAVIPTLPPPSLDAMVTKYVRSVSQASLQESGWGLADAPNQEIMTRLRAAGTPLGEYVEGKMYRGILTGLNAAFVIQAETRAKLIAEDARSAEVIKPFLAGRDVKRYKNVKAIDHLILIPSGWTREKLGWQRNKRGTFAVEPITPKYASGWDALVAHYPAIAAHLLPFQKAAIARSDQGQFWWELRPLENYAAFEQPKIMWKEIAIYQEFTLDTDGNYANNKTFFTPGNDLYLLGVLNSATAFYFLQQITTKMKDNAMAMQIPQVSQIPIPHATPAEQAAIAALVTQILAAKAADPAADTRAAEAAVDAAVAALYGVALPAAG